MKPCLLPLVAVMVAVSTGGCVPTKSATFTACFKKDAEEYLRPRPQGSPPDAFILNVVNLCMMSSGYKLDESRGAGCGSPRTVTAACFSPIMPQAWLGHLLD